MPKMKTETRICTKCREVKSLDDFFKAKKGKFGRESVCKVCKAAALLEWQRNNPEKCAVYRKQYAATPKGKSTRAKYVKEHVDETNAAKRARRAKKPSAKRLRKAQWELSPPATKVCKDCGIEKMLDQFYSNESMFSGCENTCKACKVKYATEWGDANLDKRRASVRKCNKAHPHRTRAANKKWRQKNPEKTRAQATKWQKAHPATSNKRNARHRAEKLRATPAWADQRLIQFKYDLAARMTKATGYQWDVDHIIPLRHKLVCGLHVENNLQVITHIANMKKGNRIQL